jgi:hypothetical protein
MANHDIGVIAGQGHAEPAISRGQQYIQTVWYSLGGLESIDGRSGGYTRQWYMSRLVTGIVQSQEAVDPGGGQDNPQRFDHSKNPSHRETPRDHRITLFAEL